MKLKLMVGVIGGDRRGYEGGGVGLVSEVVDEGVVVIVVVVVRICMGASVTVTVDTVVVTHDGWRSGGTVIGGVWCPPAAKGTWGRCRGRGQVRVR